MTVKPYSYTLPPERIAQRPVHPPESARMLVIERSTGVLHDATFEEMPRFLRQDDLLIFNDTKVIPARLFGTLTNDAQTPVELLLLENTERDTWLCLGRPLKKIRVVGAVQLNETLKATILPYPHLDKVLVRFETTDPEGTQAALLKHGIMPIPPYIRNGVSDEQDKTDYQSIFAREPGSVAAPTASLHFSPRLIDAITNGAGCRIETVTLHVGSASFLPVYVNGELKPPSSERLEVPAATLQAIDETRAKGKGRVIAVGTTVVRALESAFASHAPRDTAYHCATELFIQPGYRYQALDCLVTNFHQPDTTHLLLVEALTGSDLLHRSYIHALANNYRFLSYGDGMFIV